MASKSEAWEVIMRATKMRYIVFEFKQKYYLAALVNRNFNVAKTAKALGANRGDIYIHVGTCKKKMRELAREYGLLE